MKHKDAYTEIFLKAGGLEANKENIKTYRPIWWYNFRNKSEGGLRLTDEGLNFLENTAKIKSYKIEFPKNFDITPQVLVWLDNFIDSPFYITKKYIIVFREIAAFELYLFSGDVKKMGYNKALSKRLGQDS
jgi:hypothetical protein